MDNFSSRLRLVRPLEIAESHFLEILLTRFRLSRESGELGARLELSFNKETPAIWSRHAKYDIKRLMPCFVERSRKYQQELDDFLVKRKSCSYEFCDPGFPFRYASGGTLPVIHLGGEKGGREYYCLFYRDIEPVGWNIANGACDSIAELINPLFTVERELGEELLILDPRKKKRYVFEWDEGKRLDRPEFDIARRIWQEKFQRVDVSDFQELGIPLKWIKGPDSVRVHYKDQKPSPRPVTICGCFLNINAEDYGIEVDRIAKLKIDEDCILCDGEMTEGIPLNRLVGLFDVDKIDVEKLGSGHTYYPDFFFYNGKRWEPGELEKKTDEYLRGVETRRSPEEVEAYRGIHMDRRYNLCPVTRRIILRHLLQQGRKADRRNVDGSYDIFISYAGEDKDYARKVYQGLNEQKQWSVYFCKEAERRTDYSSDIDDALDGAKWLIVVATRLQHLNKRWVTYEWKSFHNAFMNGRKQDDSYIYSLISSEIPPNELPRPLCTYYEPISFDKKNIRKGIAEIVRMLEKTRDPC